LLDQLKPPRISNQIRASLATSRSSRCPTKPALSENWGEEGLSAAERLYAWNTLEVLAMSSGNIEKRQRDSGTGAGRFCSFALSVGTKVDKIVDVIRAHLHERGFPMVEVRATQSFAASRNRFR